jgi:hypothetical protein
MLRKENEFMRGEVFKERRESETLRRRLEFCNIKSEIMFREMLKRIETLENETFTVV